MLGLVGYARLKVVMAGFVVAHELETHYVGSQVVAGVLHIGTHAETLLCLCVREPVLACDVVGLLFLAVESGCQEFYLR